MCAEGLELSVCDPLHLYNETWLPLSIILTDYALIKKKHYWIEAGGRERKLVKRDESFIILSGRLLVFILYLLASLPITLSFCLCHILLFRLCVCVCVCVTQLASLMAGCAEITEPHCSHASPQAARQRIRVHCFCLRPPPGQANLNLSNLRTSFAGEYSVTLFAAKHNSQALIIIN